MSLKNWLRSRSVESTPSRVTRHRLGVQVLEDRSVPSADFLSALGVGNETGGTTARDVAVDAAGNTYLSGEFSGTVDFDPARTHPGDADVLTASGPSDIFVARYAPDDSLVWARRMGGDGTHPQGFPESGQSIAVDGAGNVCVAGVFLGTADFGGVSRVSAGNFDGFVSKLDGNGQFLWTNRWGTTSDERAVSVGVDAAGNVYTSGARITPGTNVVGSNGHDVLRFSATGNAQWAKWVGTRTSSSSGDMAVDAAGNVFVASTFQGTVDFDPGPKTRSSSSGYYPNGFVLKLTSAGAFGWVSTFAGQGSGSAAGFSFPQSVALDGDGNVVVGGYYSGPVDFNPGTGTTTLPTVGGGFITKLTNNGSLAWAKALEKDTTNGSSNVFVYGLAADAAGSIYATGSLTGTADFDPGAGSSTRTSAGGSDAYVLKLDAAGNFGWAETFGGTGADFGSGIAVDAAGTIHMAGRYIGTVDFDPDPLDAYELTTPGTYSNLFLVKLR